MHEGEARAEPLVGVIGTNEDAPADPDADDVSTPPAPTATANTAPNAAHLDRPPTDPNMTIPFRPSNPDESNGQVERKPSEPDADPQRTVRTRRLFTLLRVVCHRPIRPRPDSQPIGAFVAPAMLSATSRLIEVPCGALANATFNVCAISGQRRLDVRSDRPRSRGRGHSSVAASWWVRVNGSRLVRVVVVQCGAGR